MVNDGEYNSLDYDEVIINIIEVNTPPALDDIELNYIINRLSELESNKEYQTHEFYYTLGLTYHLIGNLKLAKKYYLISSDLYDDQEVNYPELGLKLIK